MTTKILATAFAVALFLCASISAQTTQFTYQGSLKDGANQANGNYDFEFALFDAVSGGTQLGSTLSRNSIAVVNGVFSVSLDFGSQFPGTSRFLEIRVRLAGQPGITILGPRQLINSVPYSYKSLNADTAAIAADAAKLGGVAAGQYVVTTDSRMTDARPPTVGSTNYVQNTASPQASSNFNISGTGTANVLNASQYNIDGTPILKGSTYNVFLGVNAGPLTTTGGNTFVGGPAGAHNTKGFGNSFFGSGAGELNTTGSGNTFVGYQSGATLQVNNNTTLVGSGTSASEGLTNATAIGASAVVSQNNSVVLGNGANVGIGTNSPNYKLHVVGENIRVDSNTSSIFPRFSWNFTGGITNGKKWQAYASGDASNGYLSFSSLNDAEDSESIWMRVSKNGMGSVVQFPTANVGISNNLGVSGMLTAGSFVSVGTLGSAGATTLCRNASNLISTCSSSLRYKTNIGAFSNGMSFVSQLRPISFDWKDGGMKDIGFGAEDIAKIDPRFVTYNDKGEVEGVKYDRLSVAFVNAFKEQQQQIEKQQTQIESQQNENAELKKEINALKSVVCSIRPDADICKAQGEIK